MPQKYTFIIIILYAAIQLVIYLLREAAKKRQQMQRREAMERARAGTVQQPSGPVTSPGQMRTTESGPPIQSSSQSVGASPAPISARTGRPIDDLAARRQAQIEQLRTRQQGGKIASVQTAPMRTGRTSIPGLPPTVPSAPQRADAKPRAADPMWSSRSDQVKREQEELKTRRERQQQAIQQREAQSRAAKQNQAETRARREAAKRPQAPTTPVAESDISPEVQPTASQSIYRALKDPAQLRRVFVFRELVDPPPALREPDF